MGEIRNKIYDQKKTSIASFLEKSYITIQSLIFKTILFLLSVEFITVEDFIKPWPKMLSLELFEIFWA